MDIVIGTKNKRKREELFTMLALPGLTLRGIDEFANAPEVEEDAPDFMGNAAKKAIELARFVNGLALGEDSGLVVPALGGAPGVYSARYAGEPRDDERNNDKLLAALAGRPMEERAAYYVCAMAVADTTGRVLTRAEGRFHGLIMPERRGLLGFGYDSLFFAPSLAGTFGELGLAVKSHHSHRANAAAMLREALNRGDIDRGEAE